MIRALGRMDKVTVSAWAERAVEENENLVEKIKTLEDWRAMREKDFVCIV